MTCAVCILDDIDIKLWGMTARQRLERQLRSLGITEFLATPTTPTAAERVLLIHAAYLFDTRTLAELLSRTDAVLRAPLDDRVVAAIAPANRIAAYTAAFTPAVHVPDGAEHVRPGDLKRYDDELRQSVPLLFEPITAANRQALESRLYGNAYKGITDLVTKWWWPRPARRLVALCADAGITPNMVTVTGFVLMLIATALFWHGHYLSGLICGWSMTLLDTVDGKLARVTVQSSRFGHLLDHGMDIVHPPFWYVLWGAGLGVDVIAGYAVADLNQAIVIGYIGGRLLEGLFHAFGHCSLFAWRPFDAYFRLITARRNPCLIILTVAAIAGQPALGFFGVAAWTVLSTAVMTVRLIQAAVARLGGPPLESWLKDPAASTRHPAAYRRFAGTAGAYE